MLARALNEQGLSELNEHVVKLREGGSAQTPNWLLDDERTSVALTASVDLETPSFASRYDMGCYVREKLSTLDMQPLMGNRGFWSWLALYWFDQLCPAGTRPSMPYNYVLSADYRHRPRHAVFITWQLVSRYGEEARFLLCNDMKNRGELMEQLMARQDMLGLEGVMRLASRLYADPVSGRFKRGAASRKSGGCVSRYVAWLQQLELTYDLYSISATELEELLPREFDRFRRQPVPAG